MERSIVTEILAGQDEKNRRRHSQYLTFNTKAGTQEPFIAATTEADLVAPNNREEHVFSPVSSVSEDIVLAEGMIEVCVFHGD